MQTTPGSPPPKRTRAKAKSDSAQPVITVKKSRARKTAPAAEPAPEVIPAEARATEWDAGQVNSMVATAAYFLAAERGFAPGHELDDWLEAERRVKVLCFG